MENDRVAFRGVFRDMLRGGEFPTKSYSFHKINNIQGGGGFANIFPTRWIS